MRHPEVRKAPRRRRYKKTRRNTTSPPIPGPAKCSPFAATRRNGDTCLPKQVVQKIAATSGTIRQGGRRNGDGFSAGSAANNTDLKELARNLGCDASDSRCIVEKSLLSHREKKALLQTFFRPAMPDAWKKDPDMWLNSDDIANVMRQYEHAYPDFKFLGVVPIDFSAPDPYAKQEGKCMNNQFCLVDLAAEKAAGRRILGAVFNLDPHYKDGSHWVALAVDLKNECVYYFDSYGMPPPPQVARYMRYLTTQNPRLTLQSNGRRFQYKDSECGMYSLYFIIRMIAGESFKKFCKHRIADKWMLEFRKVLFDPDA